MNTLALRFVCLALVLACFSNVGAHETWLAPSDFTSEPGSEIHFSLTSGMNFPTLEYPIRPERVSNASVRQNKKISDLIDPHSAKASLQFQNSFFAPGLVTAWITLHPKTLELTEAKIAEYFEEISAPSEIRELWAKLKGKYKWSETYTKCAKTFIAVGDSASDSSWKEAVGMPLEIVPLNNPTTAHRGEIMSVQLIANGKPLPNAPLGLMPNADGKRAFQITDANGRANFILEHGGPALLFAVKLDWREPEWVSTFTTMSFQIAQ